MNGLILNQSTYILITLYISLLIIIKMVECMFSFPVGGGAICSGGVKIASGFGATAVCIGLTIAIVIIAVGVFFWLRRKGQA